MAIEIESRDGFDFNVAIEYDDMGRFPWKEEDGHGPVSDWRKRGYNGHYPKAPGEMLLHCDGRAALFYDYQEACKIALAEGWNCAPYNIEGETDKQRAARAAMADYKRLRDYCAGHWSYVGVIVTASRHGIELASASLWGIESDAGDYLEEVARELAGEVQEQAREQVAALCECE